MLQSSAVLLHCVFEVIKIYSRVTMQTVGKLEKISSLRGECRRFHTEHEGVTEWSDEYENNVNHMLQPTQSPDLNPFE